MKRTIHISKFYFILTAIFSLGIIVIFWAAMEEYQGLVAGTDTDSVNVSVRVLDMISISSPHDVRLYPDIVGTGSSDGKVTWNVFTNVASGWKLEAHANSSPAMKSGDNFFSDYTESSPGVPEKWSVRSSNSEFGFSVFGTDAESGYADGEKFLGFNGLADIQVARSSSATPGGGSDVALYFKAEVGKRHSQSPGKYSAKITVTASTL